ncbi:MAG: DUF1552 domain-containing protein [Planctomycetota bacterium]
MLERRDFLRASTLAGGGFMLAPWLRELLGAPVTGKAPRRFIFMHKGNGLFPEVMIPPSLSADESALEQAKQAFSVDLNKHELPDWMQPIGRHQNSLTILQGLSGMMCTTGHHTWQSSLGVYKANERLSSIKWATVDFELARLFPSPFEHIELACFPDGGGNSRGNIEGIDVGFSARAAGQPNYAFGSPKVALRELFKSVTADKDAQARYALERKLLEFTAGNESSLAGDLQGGERAKVANYAEAVNDIRRRNEKVDGMAEAIRRNLPQLDPKYLADSLTTVDRQRGHVEILLSTLIAGMTNVVAFTVDELGTPYTGLPGVENYPVNLHDVGHGKGFGNLTALEIRKAVRTQHMQLIDTIISRLKAVPEEDGNMFDNTMIFYFADNGETHHSNGHEWPFMVFSGRHAKLDIAGRYIRLPKHGEAGHKTLGNWYTTILNAYGHPIKHFGDLDMALESKKLPQVGPITEFLA